MFRKRLTILIITLLTISFSANLIRVTDFKGIDQKTSPEKIMQGRAVDITNLDFDVAGSIQTRKGIEYQQSFNDNIKNINDRAVNNYIFDNSIEYKGVVGSYNVSQYTNIGDDIYFFGQDNIKWHNANTSFKTLGYDAPTSMNATSTAITGNLYGTYNYAITYVYDNSAESQPFYISETATGSVNFSNGNIALDLGSGNKFYMQTVGGVITGYYTDSDIVQVKRDLTIVGNWIWQYYEDGYLYLVTREGIATPYTYRYYKIDLDLVQIEHEASDVFSSIDGKPVFGEPAFAVYGGLFFIVVSSYSDYSASYKLRRFIVYKYGGSWSAKVVHYDQGTDRYNYIQGTVDTSRFSNIGLYITSSNAYIYGYGNPYINGNIDLNLIYISSLMWKLDGSSYERKTESEYNTEPSPLYAQNIILSKNSYIEYDDSYINWDNINGVISSNASYFSVNTTNKLQSLENDVWKEYTYNILTPTINLTSLNVWSLKTEATKIIAINQKVLIYLPEVPTLSTGINIYRQWNSTGYFFLDNIVYGNTTYLDNIANIDQSVVPMETDNNSPPNAIDSEYIVARQFYLAPDGVVWYSKINKFESVPASNYIRIKTDSDDSPVRVIEHFGGLLVFFQKSIWYIDLSSAEPIMWIPRKLNTDFGCPYPNSVVKGKLPNQQIGIFYMAEDKSIRVLTGVGADSIQLFDNIYTDKLSLGVEQSLKTDESSVDDVYLTFYDYKLYVLLQNNLLIWDSQVGGEWTKYELPISVNYIDKVDDALIIVSGNKLYYFSEDYTDKLSIVPTPKMIINGTFDTNTANWLLHTGTRLIDVSVNAGMLILSMNYKNEVCGLYQKFDLIPDVTYNMSFYFDRVSTLNPRTYPIIYISTSSNFNSLIYTYAVNGFVYSPISGNASFSFKSTTTSVAMFLDLSPEGGVCYFDNISISRSVEYIETPISWNYKTKIYADNYEFSSEFDRIWLRGYQESDAERVRVDLKNNKNNATKTNTLYMSVSGNAEVNTAVNSLVGSNGRDIQAELSGSKYIRLDGISIKYSPREE